MLLETAELAEIMLIYIAEQRHAGMFRMIYARMEMDRGVAEAEDGSVRLNEMRIGRRRS